MLDYKRIYVDTAQKTETSSDYSVMQVWGKVDNKIYLLDQVRGKFEYPELKQLLKAFLVKHSDAEYGAIEDKVSGTSLIQDVRREQPMMINAINRSKDKYTRAFDCQGYVKAGNVYLNCMADYYTDFISEATAFSSDGSHKHDDQIDPFMDAVNEMLINPATRDGKKKYSNAILSSNMRIV
jgi:predicted phage terminase large subunit-like protein